MTYGKAPGDTTAAQLLAVRATVNLPGLNAGATALVDPARPYIHDCLKGQYLVALPQAQQPSANDD